MPRGSIGQADVTFGTTSIEDELSSCTINFDVPAAEITAFTDAYQNVVAGKPSAKLDMAGSWDPATSQGDVAFFAQLGGTAVVWDFEPDGDKGYDGYGIITSYSVTATITDAVKYSVSLQHNGSSAAGGQAVNRA